MKNVRRGVKKINSEQRKRLDAIGFHWESSTYRFERQWKERLEGLKEYKRVHGDCLIPWQYKHDKALSEWVHTQRKVYSKGEMREDRKKMLDEIGFVWKPGDASHG